MFGYVKVHSPELKLKEYELYRGVYCGLCRSMGHCTGQCSRMTLSYDFAFLALVRLTLEQAPIAFDQRRCLLHPLRKRNMMRHNPVLAYCASASALLNYHKVMDDLADERGGKRLLARLLRPWVAHARKKAMKAGLGDLDAAITEGLRRLAEIEQSKELSVDLPADAFGSILAEIMSHGLEDPEKRIAAALGMAVGKWIYMADALDDWQMDAKRKRYNPFILLYGEDLPKGSELQGIQDALKNGLYHAEAALNLMEFSNPDIENILCNILYLGMPKRIETITQGGSPKSKERKERTEHLDERSL